MKNKKIRVISWIDTAIFPGTIMFTCGYEYDEIFKILKNKKDAKGWLECIKDDKELIDNNGCLALKRSRINKRGKEITDYYIIIKKVFTFTDFEYCCLAHEVLHICQFLLPDLLNRDKEHECEAYFHTYIMHECLKILRG